ncbi:MAG: hypothetical protein JXL97_03170 [Bacteroidales bacterium]|nr:hypothetical protein [Bacteroidales bacterium]
MKKKHIILALFSAIFLFSCDEVNEAKQVVDDFYKCRQEQNYDKVVSYLSDIIFEISTEEEIIADLKKVDEEMGNINSFKSTSFEIKTNNGITTAIFTYKVVYDKGVMTDNIELQKEGDTYKIYYYYWTKN